MAKLGVLLLNLGSPASTAVPDVREYLKEFLLDERVIDSPPLVRNAIVRGLILPTRPPKTAAAYQRIWTPEGSPLVTVSEKQRDLVAAGRDIPIALAMRYGEPAIAKVIGKLIAQDVDRLFVMPLYPHYAMSSYETVVVRVMEEIAAQKPAMDVTLLQPFYQDEDYIEAMVANAKPYFDQGYDHILFSYHGIPERHLRKGDPSHAHCLARPDCCESCHPAHHTCYRHQCFATTRAIVAKAGIPAEKHSVSFQSRLGRDPWLKPYTDFVLEELPAKGVKKLLVMCPAFTTDCLETLEEISMEGKESFLKAGGQEFAQIPCLNASPPLIKFLNGRIDQWIAQ
ncbi:ferrochelatase [Cerasicoccus arenae]|uniref:Ferrochelatase n=1 Tax=Cerasicoccus arenae TaxID=424488 RepID=A0A8J3GE91_9BACT|nr:ferrochelatase [Cerasicoccus arenae]MBK1859534.1 ferrochelatase [Cerasicoccus arenae]GHB97203.1 ferrochelatase [Cerasicoccus arenae]